MTTIERIIEAPLPRQGLTAAPSEPDAASEDDRGAFPLRRDVPVMVAVAVITATVYAATMLPGTGGSGDTAKWQFLGKVGGLPHPTGYPLYLLLNKAFVTAVPFGSTAWRANLLSVVCATAAVVVLYRLLQAIGVRRPVAAPTALVFAFSLTFWSQAVVAEVYTLHVLLMVSVLACAARWKLGGSDTWFLVATALYAVSFGNHLSSLLLLPGFAWVVWTERRRAFTATNVAWVLAWTVLGVAQYGLVWAARNGVYVEARLHSFADLTDYLSGGWFKDRMFAFGPREMITVRAPMLARLTVAEFGVLCLPAAYGVWRGVARRGPRRALCVALVLYASVTIVYGLGYDIPDVSVYFLPLFLAIAIFLGLGVDGLLLAAGGRRLPWPVTAAVAAVLPALALGLNWSRVDMSGDTRAPASVDSALARVPDGAELVIEDYPFYMYVQERLLGDGTGDARDIVASHATADGVVTNLQDQQTGRYRPLYWLGGPFSADPRPVLITLPGSGAG